MHIQYHINRHRKHNQTLLVAARHIQIHKNVQLQENVQVHKWAHP